MVPKVYSVIAAPILGWGAGSSPSDRIGAAGDNQRILELVEPALQLLMFKLIFKFELKITHGA